jgi:tetratricopeptide (TPR) repeat protein
MRAVIVFLLLYSFNCNAVENQNLLDGKVFFKEGKFLDSKFMFEKSIVFEPKNLEGYLYLSKVFEKLKNLEEQEKNIRTVLLLDPKNEEALSLVINLNIKKGDFKESEQKYEFFKNTCKNCEGLREIEKLIEKLKTK